MPFNTFILTCLSEKTSFAEKGGRVSVIPKPGEIVLFFVIDERTNKNSTARQDLPISGKICDLIVYYAKDCEKVICLVESKGSSVKDAIEQVINTRDHLQKSLNNSTTGKACHCQCNTIKWKTYISLHGSSPKITKDYHKELESFGKGNYMVKRGGDLLGPLLRN
jgi:hypothetical protein